jgi:hypothetical protein
MGILVTGFIFIWCALGDENLLEVFASWKGIFRRKIRFREASLYYVDRLGWWERNSTMESQM